MWSPGNMVTLLLGILSSPPDFPSPEQSGLRYALVGQNYATAPHVFQIAGAPVHQSKGGETRVVHPDPVVRGVDGRRSACHSIRNRLRTAICCRLSADV
jgi:hypothetical protein